MRDFHLFSLRDSIVRSMEDSKLYAVKIAREVHKGLFIKLYGMHNAFFLCMEGD